MRLKHKAEEPKETSISENMTSTGFTLRAPFWSYRAVEYKSYAPLDELKAEIDDRLEALFRGQIDSGNADVLDFVLFDVVRMARADLDRQQVHHRHGIASLEIRPSGDISQFKAEREQLDRDLTRNKEEQELIRRLLRESEYKED